MKNFIILSLLECLGHGASCIVCMHAQNILLKKHPMQKDAHVLFVNTFAYNSSTTCTRHSHLYMTVLLDTNRYISLLLPYETLLTHVIHCKIFKNDIYVEIRQFAVLWRTR